MMKRKNGEGIVWKRRSTKDEIMIKSEDETEEYIEKKKKKKKKKKKEGKPKGYDLVSYEELPDYMKDNEFILNYYRSDWPLKQALFSVFRWHNETLNVWTHLIGFVFFLVLTIANLIQVPQLSDFLYIFSTWSFPLSSETNVSHNSRDFFSGTTNLIDLHPKSPLSSPELAVVRWPFFVFLGGSMFCLLSSSTCHLFSCHSHHLNLKLLQMDYAGITIMIITSFFPPIYYIFQCQPYWQFIYLGGITTMGLFTIITLLSPALSTGNFRSFRALLFVGMGLSGIIPAIHAVVLNWNEPQRDVTVAYESAMAMSYLIGTVFYVSRIPERWRPGWFDLAGHSHQIFHVFVILGAVAHYCAALVFLDFRGRVTCENFSD